MKKILLVQSRENLDSVAAEQEHYRRALTGAAELDALSVLDEKLAWTTPDEILADYAGVIFGGSGEFDLHGGRDQKDPLRLMAMIILTRLRMFISYVLAEQKPTLGVCFGHQLIGQMRGGEVEHDSAQTKVGTHEVSLTEEGKADPVFKHLPAAFLAQYAHHDSITAMPEGAVVLGSGSNCSFSALRYGKTVYTMQFHPELSAADAIARLDANKRYLPPDVSASSIVRDSPEASRIIPLWAEHVVAE